MINAQDFFYIAVAVAFIILTGFLSWAAFELVRTLKSVKHVVDGIGATTDDINALREGLKVGLLKIAGSIAKSKVKRRWLK